MEVHTSVSEADVGKLRGQMPATFTVDAYPTEKFSGVVREIRNAPQVVQNVVTYDAVIDVGNAELKLKPGMTANVTFVYAERVKALQVANDPFGREISAQLAKRVRPDLDGDQPAHAASLETLLRLAALGQGLVVLGGSQAGGLPPILVCRPIADPEIGFGAVWSPRNEKLALRRALRLALELSGQTPCPSAPRAGRAQSRDPSP